MDFRKNWVRRGRTFDKWLFHSNSFAVQIVAPSKSIMFVQFGSFVSFFKKQEKTDEQLIAKKRLGKIRKKRDYIKLWIPAEDLELAKLGEENAMNSEVTNKAEEIAQNGIQRRLTHSQDVANQLRASRGQHKNYRAFLATSTSTNPPTGNELRERSAHSQKDINKVTSKESNLRTNKTFFLDNLMQRVVLDRLCARIRKNTFKLGRPWEQWSKLQAWNVQVIKMNRRKQRTISWTSEKKRFCLKLLTRQKKERRWRNLYLSKSSVQTSPELMETWRTKSSTVSHLRAKYSSIAVCKANKRTSKLLRGEYIWDWPETFVVDDGWQDFLSETLFVYTIQALEEEG